MKKHIVVEVRGGIVVEVYLDDPDTQVTLIDWDCEDEPPRQVADETGREWSGMSVVFPTSRLEAMPVETRQAFEHACFL